MQVRRLFIGIAVIALAGTGILFFLSQPKPATYLSAPGLVDKCAIGKDVEIQLCGLEGNTLVPVSLENPKALEGQFVVAKANFVQLAKAKNIDTRKQYQTCVYTMLDPQEGKKLSSDYLGTLAFRTFLFDSREWMYCVQPRPLTQEDMKIAGVFTFSPAFSRPTVFGVWVFPVIEGKAINSIETLRELFPQRIELFKMTYTREENKLGISQ